MKRQRNRRKNLRFSPVSTPEQKVQFHSRVHKYIAEVSQSSMPRHQFPSSSLLSPVSAPLVFFDQVEEKAGRKKQEEESKKEKRRKQAVIIKNQPRIPQSFLTKIKRARKKRKNRKKNAKSFAGSGKSSTFALAFRKTVQLRRQEC